MSLKWSFLLARLLVSNFTEGGGSCFSLSIKNAVGLHGRLISIKSPHPNMCSVMHKGLLTCGYSRFFNLCSLSIRCHACQKALCRTDAKCALGFKRKQRMEDARFFFCSLRDSFILSHQKQTQRSDLPKSGHCRPNGDRSTAHVRMPHLFWCWTWPQRLTQSGPFPPISPSCPRAAPLWAPHPRGSPRRPHAARHPRPPGCRRSRVWPRRSRLWRRLWDPLERCSTQSPARCTPTGRDCLRGSPGAGRWRVQHRRASPLKAPPPSRAEALGPTAPPSSRRGPALSPRTADCKWRFSRQAPGCVRRQLHLGGEFHSFEVISNCRKGLHCFACNS